MSIHKGKFCNETPQLESIKGGASVWFLWNHNQKLHHIHWKDPFITLHVLYFKLYLYILWSIFTLMTQDFFSIWWLTHKLIDYKILLVITVAQMTKMIDIQRHLRPIFCSVSEHNVLMCFWNEQVTPSQTSAVVLLGFTLGVARTPSLLHIILTNTFRLCFLVIFISSEHLGRRLLTLSAMPGTMVSIWHHPCHSAAYHCIFTTIWENLMVKLFYELAMLKIWIYACVKLIILYPSFFPPLGTNLLCFLNSFKTQLHWQQLWHLIALFLGFHAMSTVSSSMQIST